MLSLETLELPPYFCPLQWRNEKACVHFTGNECLIQACRLHISKNCSQGILIMHILSAFSLPAPHALLCLSAWSQTHVKDEGKNWAVPILSLQIGCFSFTSGLFGSCGWQNWVVSIQFPLSKQRGFVLPVIPCKCWRKILTSDCDLSNRGFCVCVILQFRNSLGLLSHFLGSKLYLENEAKAVREENKCHY